MIPVTTYGEQLCTCRVKNYFGLKLVNRKYYKRLVKTYKYACTFLSDPPKFKFAHAIGNKVTFKAYCKLYNAIPQLVALIDPRNIPPAIGKLRERQVKDAKYAAEIIHLLEENGLRPFLDAGTALGAVRHGGFIPWDDDIDIALVREDFEKAKKVLCDKFVQLDSKNITNANKKKMLQEMFEKYPNQTFVFKSLTALRLYNGISLKDCVCCDVFSYGYYTKECTLADYHELGKKQYAIAIQQELTHGQVHQALDKIKQESPFVAQDKTNKIAPDVGNYSAIFYHMKDFMEEKDIFPLQTILFEGYEMPCVANTDKFLRMIYGDYMKLPRDFGVQRHFQYLVEENKASDGEYLKCAQRYLRRIKQIKEKIKRGEKVRVAFYVNDTKWKCQNLFDLMKKSKDYDPFVLVARTCGKKEAQTEKELEDIVKFFEERNMPVYRIYKPNKKAPIAIKKFKPDIVFYSRPWGIAKGHNIKSVSKSALTAYVPYFISNSSAELEANGKFQNRLWKYYILNEDLRREYAQCMANQGRNLAVVGYPLMETYIGYQPSDKRQNYVIYAPHWSVGETKLKYATFDWSGPYMLEFAQKHPEIKWVFKPHPILKKTLVNTKHMTEEEVDKYWDAWDKIAIKYEGPEYLDLFKQSKALITDCGSFLAEYMPTQNPVILLRSKSASPYNFLGQKVTKYYYSVWNVDELSEKLKTIVMGNEDPWKKERLSMLDSLKLITNASENIISDLNKTFGIDE